MNKLNQRPTFRTTDGQRRKPHPHQAGKNVQRDKGLALPEENYISLIRHFFSFQQSLFLFPQAELDSSLANPFPQGDKKVGVAKWQWGSRNGTSGREMVVAVAKWHWRSRNGTWEFTTSRPRSRSGLVAKWYTPPNSVWMFVPLLVMICLWHSIQRGWRPSDYDEYRIASKFYQHMNSGVEIAIDETLGQNNHAEEAFS